MDPSDSGEAPGLAGLRLSAGPGTYLRTSRADRWVTVPNVATALNPNHFEARPSN